MDSLRANDEVLCGREGNYLIGRILYFSKRQPIVVFNKKYNLPKSSYRVPIQFVNSKCGGIKPKKSIVTLKFFKNNICGN